MADTSTIGSRHASVSLEDKPRSRERPESKPVQHQIESTGGCETLRRRLVAADSPTEFSGPTL